MDTLMTLLGAAGVTFVMGVPGADDIMLNYQSTSFHDAAVLREVLGRSAELFWRFSHIVIRGPEIVLRISSRCSAPRTRFC
jgi:ethanolamine ammonia-lyase large subunit